MEHDVEAIIVCGGKGSRMKSSLQNKKCKSLIPILGIPVISYVTYALRKIVPNAKIILAIDNPELKNKFEQVYKTQKIQNYQVYDGLPRGPVQAFYEAGSSCRSNKVLIFFGNQLVSPNHIRKLLSHEEDMLVLSAFSLLSENNCKIATIDDTSRVLDVARYGHLESLKSREVYLDVPYAVPNSFFSMETFPEIKRLFVKTPMEKAHLTEESRVIVEKSDFPAEFHFKEELKGLEKQVLKYFPDFINKWGERFDE